MSRSLTSTDRLNLLAVSQPEINLLVRNRVILGLARPWLKGNLWLLLRIVVGGSDRFVTVFSPVLKGKVVFVHFVYHPGMWYLAPRVKYPSKNPAPFVMLIEKQ